MPKKPRRRENHGPVKLYVAFFSAGIENVTVSASSLLLNVSDKVVINCTVIGGPDDLNITWFKGNTVIGLTQRTKVETRLRRSLLTIRDVVAEDEGNYTCVAR